MSLLLGILFIAGCAPGEQREYWGNLYFGIGAYLGQLDLRDGSVSLLANLGDTSIREIDAFGDDQLLLSVLGPVNRKDTYRLMQYDLEGNGLATLINGRHGRYLPGPEVLVFDDGAHLKTRIYGGGGMEQLVVAQHRFGARAYILQVSATEFIHSIDPDSTIYSFDVETRVLRPLPGLSRQCRIDGALWIAARRELLCKRGEDTSEYAFVSLDGEVRGALDIPDARPFRAIAHLDDQDALVLSETWHTFVSRRERNAIWIYDLTTDRMTRLAKNQSIGSLAVYKSGT